MYIDSPPQSCVSVCVQLVPKFWITASSVAHLPLIALLGLCAMPEALPRIWKRTKRWGLRQVKILRGIPGWWARQNLFFQILSEIKDPIERDYYFMFIAERMGPDELLYGQQTGKHPWKVIELPDKRRKKKKRRQTKITEFFPRVRQAPSACSCSLI